MGLCPKYYAKKNFYLKSLTKPKPTQWYCNHLVGQNTLAGVVKVLMKEAGIEGFFTNHSLRRTGGTHLFQAGVDRKLVKEATGHRSDSIDTYQITSDEQRQWLSKIIAKPPSETLSRNPENCTNSTVKGSECNETSDSNVTVNGKSVCVCQCASASNVTNVVKIVSEAIKGCKKNGKTTIKLQIEIINE